MRRPFFAVRLFVLLLFALLLSTTARAAPPSIADFAATRPWDNRRFILLGSGSTDVYAIALYVDETPAHRAFPALTVRAGGRQHSRLLAGDHAQEFVVWG